MFNYNCSGANSGNNTFNNSQIINVNNYYIYPQTLPIFQTISPIPLPYQPYQPYGPYQPHTIPYVPHPYSLFPHLRITSPINLPSIPPMSLTGKKRKYDEAMNDEQENIRNSMDTNKKRRKSTSKRRKQPKVDDEIATRKNKSYKQSKSNGKYSFNNSSNYYNDYYKVDLRQNNYHDRNRYHYTDGRYNRNRYNRKNKYKQRSSKQDKPYQNRYKNGGNYKNDNKNRNKNKSEEYNQYACPSYSVKTIVRNEENNNDQSMAQNRHDNNNDDGSQQQ